mmetsp:Transcript_26252/g.36570  ORF Transcript_26252/g.36570 Transcript_26252/m.36570 type:complete len:143 (+) Transcript_26252:237-665(+)
MMSGARIQAKNTAKKRRIRLAAEGEEVEVQVVVVKEADVVVAVVEGDDAVEAAGEDPEEEQPQQKVKEIRKTIQNKNRPLRMVRTLLHRRRTPRKTGHRHKLHLRRILSSQIPTSKTPISIRTGANQRQHRPPHRHLPLNPL